MAIGLAAQEGAPMTLPPPLRWYRAGALSVIVGAVVFGYLCYRWQQRAEDARMVAVAATAKEAGALAVTQRRLTSAMLENDDLRARVATLVDAGGHIQEHIQI